MTMKVKGNLQVDKNINVLAGFGGVSTLGNTSGSTGLASQVLVLAGGNNITLSQSTLGGSATITISAAAGGGGAGVTVSHWPPFPVGLATSSNNIGTSGATGGSTQFTGSFHVAPLLLDATLSFSRLNVQQSYATSAGTGSMSLQLQVGIYTLNGGTALSSLSTFMFRHEISQNSVTARTHRFYWGTNSTSNSSSSSGNISTAYTGLRNIPLYAETSGSLSAGQYWIVFNQINRSSGVNVMPAATLNYISASSAFTGAAELGTATTHPPLPLLGQFSSTTNTNVLTAPFMPASIHTSVITRTGGSSLHKWPYVNFIATT
jgi:hypothetical protein